MNAARLKVVYQQLCLHIPPRHPSHKKSAGCPCASEVVQSKLEPVAAHHTALEGAGLHQTFNRLVAAAGV